VQNVLRSELAVDGAKLNCSLSEKLVNHPDDQGGQYIGEYICEQINSESELPKSYDLTAYTTPWQTATKKEICVACAIRPQGYGADQIPDYHKDPCYYSRKARLRKLCCICMDRRRGVAERWATEGMQDHTVWIDEVSDMNGRVVLIVGQFDLQNWTMLYPPNGNLFDWNNVPGNDNGRLLRFLKDDLDVDWAESANICKSDDGKTILISNDENSAEITIDEIDKRAVLKIGDDKTCNLNVEGNNGKLHIQFCVMTKSQSFARIRRVWETTRRFWQEILPIDKEAEISESEGGIAIGLVGHRLRIKGKLHSTEKNDTPGQYHAYELPLLGAKLSVVWVPEDDGSGGYFVTAKNPPLIARLLRKPLPDRDKTESVIECQKRLHKWAAETLEKEIRGRGTLAIEEPTGYGSQNKVWGTIEIEEVKPIPDSTYTPAIPILAEPRTFMALVPADKAIGVVSAINEKYEREMGKVRNRLPLHLGVVFAPYKTPLRAIMDAGRRMLKQKTSADGWKVAKKSLYLLPSFLHADPHFAAYIRLELAKDDRDAVWHVPLRMGDGKTTDEWYPYVFVEKDKAGEPPTDRKRMFEAPCPWNENKPT
jgi:hypothetical protein